MSESSVAPVHTGVASDEAFKIETHGIDYVPPGDRHGRPFELFWLWLGAQVNIYPIIIGALCVGLGLSFWAAIAVVIVANFAWPLVGLMGIAGPKAGNATLIISRSPFGVLGNRPAALLSWLTLLGWEAAGVIIATLSLYELAQKAGLPGNAGVKAACLAIIMVVTFGVAIWGHATIALLEKWFAILLAIAAVIIAIYVIPKAGVSHAAAPLAAKTAAGTWLLALIIFMAGVPMSWLNFPAEYARYLPENSSSKAVFWWTTLGGWVAAVFLGIVGVAAATATANPDPIAGITGLLPSGLAIPFLLIVVAGMVTNNFLNTYSSGLNLLVLGLKVQRYKSVFIDAVVAGLVSIYAVFFHNFYNLLVEYLSFLILWIAPFAGVYLADMFLRRNTYDPRGLITVGSGPYWYSRGWNSRGVIAFGLGIIAGALFINAAFWQGPLIGLVGGGDISALVGLAVGWLAYYFMMRGELRPAGVTVAPSTALKET
jgi:nucleobase:cation symporter-1, NCS1 family